MCFKPTSVAKMIKAKDLINFKETEEQKEDIEKAFSGCKPYQVKKKKSKLARAQDYMVLALHTGNHDTEAKKGWSYLIHHVQEALYSRVFNWRNVENENKDVLEKVKWKANLKELFITTVDEDGKKRS